MAAYHGGGSMSGGEGPDETRYAERSDGAERKIALLRAAWERGEYRLAAALADSLKDGLEAEWRLGGELSREVSGEADLPGDAWRPTGELPPAWQRWAAGWTRVQVVTASEGAGIARRREPVDVALRAPAAWCGSLARELRVAEVDRETGGLRVVQSQVYGEERSRGGEGAGRGGPGRPGGSDGRDGQSGKGAAAEGDVRSAHVVWQADVAAGGCATFLVFAGNPAAELPSYITDMAVRGEGFALEIENEHFVATLSRQTGQLERLRYKRAHGLELFAGGEGHGEPPHIDWAHDYLAAGKFQKLRVTNWETVRNYEVVRGPVCTTVRRWGFPHSPLHPVFTAARMLVDVTYTFYAGAPYFLKHGTMRAVQDFGLNYLRDDEWVFSGYSFTDLVWMDGDGRAHEGAVPREQAGEMWGVGFFHRQSRDAFVSLRLEHRLEPERDVTLYHADAPSLNYKGHGQLWSRWALRGDPRLKEGDMLSQRNAYLVEPYAAEGGAARLEEWRRRLVSPVEVRAGADLKAEAPRSRGASARLSARDDGEAQVASRGMLARAGETVENAALKAAVWEAMREVQDDMFYAVDANVVDMGYVYDVRVRHGADVEVLMTMPHKGRPKYRYLGNPIAARVGRVPGVRSVVVTPTWEPAWTPQRMSEAGWRAMGLDDRAA